MHARTIVDADDFIRAGASSFSRERIKNALRNTAAPFAIARVGHAWLASSQEQRGVRRGTASSVLPNMVPAPERAPDRSGRTPGRLTMVGFFPYRPNADAARWFISEVLPSVVRHNPEIQLHLVGYGSDALMDQFPRLVVPRGFVEDLAMEYDRSSLVIAPVATGAGTQIKVIDALAHQCPLLASRFAFDGFRDVLLEDVYLRVADRPTEWVKKIR